MCIYVHMSASTHGDWKKSFQSPEAGVLDSCDLLNVSDGN